MYIANELKAIASQPNTTEKISPMDEVIEVLFKEVTINQELVCQLENRLSKSLSDPNPDVSESSKKEKIQRVTYVDTLLEIKEIVCKTNQNLREIIERLLV